MAALIAVDLLYYGLVKRNKEEYAQKIILNTHKTQVCHKYIFNGTLLNRQ